MHAAPGQLIDIGGCRLHLYQQGAAGPSVVLESGIAGSLLGWSLVQPKIGEFARAYSYDRAGLGWSDHCAAPRTVEQMVSELATLLLRAEAPAPYILVGHSFGGLLIRAYAHMRAHEVAGLVFVDPVSLRTWAECEPHNQQRLQRGIQLSQRGALLARLGIVQLALSALASGGRRFPKLLVKATAKPGVHTVERLIAEVSRLPPQVWPMIRAHWSRPKSFQAMAAYLACLPACARSALAMPLPADCPVTVLSASNSTPAELQERDAWLASVNHSRHQLVSDCGHWIQLQHPQIVIDAVRQLTRQMSGNSVPGTQHLLST